jgi:hypothetical protein
VEHALALLVGDPKPARVEHVDRPRLGTPLGERLAHHAALKLVTLRQHLEGLSRRLA